MNNKKKMRTSGLIVSTKFKYYPSPYLNSQLPGHVLRMSSHFINQRPGRTPVHSLHEANEKKTGKRGASQLSSFIDR